MCSRKFIFVLFLYAVSLCSWAQEAVVVPESEEQTTDTAGIFAPLQVQQYEQETNDDIEKNPSHLDLQNPQNISTEIEFDDATGGYVIHTKMGTLDIRTPYKMSIDEFMLYSERMQLQNYWQKNIAEQSHSNESKFNLFDMKFNIGPLDKVFGPGGVQIKLQGSADLKFAFKHQYIDNPSLTARSRNNNIFDFDEKIQVNVRASVGNQINFDLNYNTLASFDFDRQNINLNYKGKEDGIIQYINMGNVSMDMNSSLIQGAQALFGIKTGLQFGKLKVQGIISQQNSQTQTVSSQGGKQTTEFSISADNYDENRHFFLSHYFRDNYERNLSTLPYVLGGIKINRIEVWVTNKRGNYDDARNLVAFTDLGENDSKHLQSTSWTVNGRNPHNKANDLYATISALPAIRDIQQTLSVLEAFQDLQVAEDFEKIESARLLSSSEYTLNEALGYISLKSALNQDEVLAVAYEYTLNGQVYQVGEFSSDASEVLRAPNALLVKMLKTSSNEPFLKGRGTWDLMMKNVYSLGASQMTAEDFELSVVYQNDANGVDVQYMPEGKLQGKLFLRILQLDNLDSKNNASPDGRFDYVENYTAISSAGKIIFPVLEPFGSYLRKQIGDNALADKYVFEELYDSTIVIAQEFTEKNKYSLKGKYRGSAANEIRLDAMNVPRGSVIVTAGGATLVENVDYSVDYMMGIVTILNQSIIDAGTSVSVQLENQSTFSMLRKSLYGIDLEYEFSKDFILGGTLMHMRQRPLTTKVNMGSEPLANTIWGMRVAWKKDFYWLTEVLDRVPWITATQPSSLALQAEFAQLIPGHTRDVGKAGTAYIDDFEGTKTSIDVHYPNSWFLASTPSMFAESSLSNNIQYGKNRARLNWYVVDPIFGYPQTNTPSYIRNDLSMLSDHRTRIIYQQEIYPNKASLANEDTRLPVLNLSFYPQDRGPYNIVADEMGADGKLTNPRQRWGGMMRKIDNTNFENANIEYLEFWMMDPALTNPEGFSADMYINLGELSEDILRDGKKSFEHGLPINESDENTEQTIWGRVPRTTSTTVAFSNESGARRYQDVGLNGLSTEQEFAFTYSDGTKPYADYVNALRTKVHDTVLTKWEADAFSPLNDPAGDNYHYYRGGDYDDRQVSILERYKYYNNPEGNSPATDQSTERYGTAATLVPDIEDINKDNTLTESERYYQYHVSLRPADLNVGMQNITEKLVTKVSLRNGQSEDVVWYQFKIPIRGNNAQCEKIGNIRSFNSIRFMRLFLTNSEKDIHLRLASLDLVRGEWRAYSKALHPPTMTPNTESTLDVQAVNIEENAGRMPVNYVLPPGISRQTDIGQAQLIAQNEQAMVLRIRDLSPHDARAVYRNVSFDMRNYKRIKMFVHAEQLPTDNTLQDGDLALFVRLGSDMNSNYYEYEIPLYLTEPGMYNNGSQADRRAVWREDNELDFALSVLTKAKLKRNRAQQAGNTDVGTTTPYIIYDDASDKPKNKITILGNPTLADVSTIMMGIRNNSSHVAHGEIWVNELRLSEFNEKGGVSAMANASLMISDIAQVNMSGKLETDGYGSIEANVLDRNMENMYQYSVSAALELGRFFPEQAKLRIPLYVSHSNEIISPKYNPLDDDLELNESLDSYDKKTRDSLKAISNTVVTSTNFSLSNFKVDISSKKQKMFYDPANFSLSAAYSKQDEHSPEVEKDVTTMHKGSLTYNYSFPAKPWEPLKKVKSLKNWRLLSDFGLYYLPQSWGASTDMVRNFSHYKLRDNVGIEGEMDLTFSKDFMWNRNFTFNYDLTKSLKFTFQTAMNSSVDEGMYTPEIIRDYHFTNDYYEAWKDTIKRSLRKGGDPYMYQQVFTASWMVPFNRTRYLNFLSANASYRADYNWTRTVQNKQLDTLSLGNIITATRTWQVDGRVNFEMLYGLSKYWKTVTQRRGAVKRRTESKSYSQTVSLNGDVPLEITHRLGTQKLKVTAQDKKGKDVPITFTLVNDNKISISTPKTKKDVFVTVTPQADKAKIGQFVGDMAIYVGTMIRNVQATYRQTNSWNIPGFYPQIGFFGQQNTGENIYAPGWDFAFGFFGSDYLDKAKRKGWLSSDTNNIQPALEAVTTDLDLRSTLEPIPGLKIQLNGRRYEASSQSIIYNYDQMLESFTGSFNITQIAITTAFAKNGTARNNYKSTLFEDFLRNRDIIANRVQRQYDGARYPNVGFLQNTPYASQRYDKTRDINVPNNSADVLIPAFLATYTGKRADRVSLNPILGFLSILPNWSITFDGLGRLPWIRDHFRGITLTHAYTCKYAIGGYTTYSTWVPTVDNGNIGFIRDVVTDEPIPSSQYDISGVSIMENFSPLAGLKVDLQNSLSFKAEYRKQRNISLSIASVQIAEGHTDEFVFGTGYIVKDLSFIAKTKEGEKKVQNDLKIAIDASYKKIETLLRKVEEDLTQASAGTKVWGLKFSADYVLSQKMSLQLYYDHQSTIPLLSTSYPIKSDEVGLIVKIMLTR